MISCRWVQAARRIDQAARCVGSGPGVEVGSILVIFGLHSELHLVPGRRGYLGCFAYPPDGGALLDLFLTLMVSRAS